MEATNLHCRPTIVANFHERRLGEGRQLSQALKDHMAQCNRCKTEQECIRGTRLANLIQNFLDYQTA